VNRPPIVADDESGRMRAVEVLRSGGIVALPTDTVYGIGCAINAPRGVERLFEVKNRPPERAIMLLLADETQANDIGIVSRAAAVLADAFWPGGLTLVVPTRQEVNLPDTLTAGGSTIGLRVPDHACPRELARVIGPFPATSANRSGAPELPTVQAIAEELRGLDLIIDGGRARGGTPSTVVDCSGDPPRIVRDGSVDRDAIDAVLESAGLRLGLPDVGR
jgi:L-threonylcarbamoyladenylate synthase